MKKLLFLLYFVSVLSGCGNAQTCTVRSQTLNVRNNAGTESEILTILASGQQVKILKDATLAGWVKISAGNIEGYVLKKYLSCNESSKTLENMVWVCMGGSAYAYHSTNTCSGLNRCKEEIITASEADAKNKYYRRPCKICY